MIKHSNLVTLCTTLSNCRVLLQKTCLHLSLLFTDFVIEKNKERDCIFLDIPLLYESHLEYLCDEIIVVYLDEQRQVQRLMARDHIDESYAYTIINNQISSLKKREMADIVFDNNQGIEELYKQIDEFIERISHEEIINE